MQKKLEIYGIDRDAKFVQCGSQISGFLEYFKMLCLIFLSVTRNLIFFLSPMSWIKINQMTALRKPIG